MKYDINRFPAMSGRIIGEDGQVYNLVDLLKDIANGTSDAKPIEPTVSNVTPTTDGASVNLE